MNKRSSTTPPNAIRYLLCNLSLQTQVTQTQVTQTQATQTQVSQTQVTQTQVGVCERHKNSRQTRWQFVGNK